MLRWHTINKNSETDVVIQSKDQKSKQSATGSYLDFSPKMVNLPTGNLRMRLILRAVSFHFIILSSSVIKGVHHHHLVSKEI